MINDAILDKFLQRGTNHSLFGSYVFFISEVFMIFTCMVFVQIRLFFCYSTGFQISYCYFLYWGQVYSYVLFDFIDSCMFKCFIFYYKYVPCIEAKKNRFILRRKLCCLSLFFGKYLLFFGEFLFVFFFQKNYFY